MTISQNTIFGMLQSGLNLITQAISIHDHELKLVLGNQRFQTMFQIPDEFMQAGTGFRELLTYLAERGEYGPVDDITSFVEEKIALAQKFEPHYFERTRANGTSISVEGNPLDQGGWISVYTDITAIKQQETLSRSRAKNLSTELLEQSKNLAESNRELEATVRALETTRLELTESRERLDLINRMTPAHIAHVDQNGKYTHSNGRLPSVATVQRNDIIGLAFDEVLGPDVVQKVEAEFQKVLLGKQTVTEFQDEQSGTIIRLAMSPDIKSDNSIRGAFILSTDVTEEVQARRALAHARRKELATQLTSVLTHDFSNLLTIIMSQQSRLEEIQTDTPALQDIADTIKSATRRGRELVNSLNRVDAERDIEESPVQVSAFVTSLEQLARAALPKTIALHVSANIPHEQILLDAGFAQDAILNLVINASEACEGHGNISISFTHTSSNELEIKVADDGPGFSKEALEKAIMPFYSTKKEKVGRGLGLVSVFDFAKSCGGSLRIRNQQSGGALARITIPYVAAKSVSDSLVLLIDDDDDVRETARSYLRRAGHTVLEANSVSEASQLMSIEGLSIVVTDLDLGASGTGLDVISIVPQDVQKLIMTGLPTTNELRQHAEKECAVLVKPFDYHELQAALARISA